MLNYLEFTEKLRNMRSRRMFANSSWGNAATAFSLSSQFYVCGRTCYKVYIGKRCILGEGKRLGGETVGLQYPVWLLRNVDRNVKTRAATNVCLHVPTFCYETQHNQRLYTPSGIGIPFTMSEAMTRSMQCPSIMISTRIVIVEAPSSQCSRRMSLTMRHYSGSSPKAGCLC